MTRSIIDISHDFFDQHIMPVLQREFPEETAQTAFGVFGQGSEALRMDDEYSRDHHFGLRIDALMPAGVFAEKREAILEAVSRSVPQRFEGHELGERLTAGTGLSPDTLDGFLQRSIGLDRAPKSAEEWLSIPEEDIIHVINGEVWHDPSGRFTAVRQRLQEYYPEEVWLRRLAHWCRYYSGMGVYALKRALLRENPVFAITAFGKSIRWGLQIAFMLDRTYYPYDKWLWDFFQDLPRMYDRIGAFVEEAVQLSTPWERKLELMDHISDALDRTMVEDGIIAPHPQWQVSPTSGYRVIENAYQQIVHKLPDHVKSLVPQWDQIYLEKFVVGYVDSLNSETWQGLLNLEPAATQDADQG